MAVIAIISDGKAGHRNQSLGLAEALCRQRPDLELREKPVAHRGALLQALLPALRDADAPKLVIGAGHGTHADLLYWRRRGSRAIVLMRPSLPLRCFDLCIEPRHDGGSEEPRRWLSTGALNCMRPAPQRDGTGLVLVGGPSPHYRWDTSAILGQLAVICDGARSWTLSTSRRTPREFLAALRDLELPGLTAYAADDLPGDWLNTTLPAASDCWVTPDSASMVYEALSAGCAVGLLRLEANANSRVARGVGELVADGMCTRFGDDGAAPAVLRAPPEPLAEADRMAARLLAEGWL